jgi:hypothetical protein
VAQLAQRQHETTYADGTAVPEISVYLDEGLRLTSAGARRFAALLVKAADELDRLECR